MTVLAPDKIQALEQYLDDRHDDFSALGKELFSVFGYDKKRHRISSQVRNLQQIVCSAVRFADIENFVKNQMGKSGNNQWRQVGDSILARLSQLRRESESLGQDRAERFAIRLKIARGWGRAIVSEYLYQVALDQMGGER